MCQALKPAYAILRRNCFQHDRKLPACHSCCLVAQSHLTLLWPCGQYPARLLCPWDFPGKSTGVGCHFLLQGIFPTQVSNTHLLHWQAHPLLLSHQGSPLRVIPTDQKNRLSDVEGPLSLISSWRWWEAEQNASPKWWDLGYSLCSPSISFPVPVNPGGWSTWSLTSCNPVIIFLGFTLSYGVRRERRK